jgi:hypothetical protein
MLKHAILWLNLEVIKWVSQTQNGKYCMISLIWGCYSCQINWDDGCQWLGEGGNSKLKTNGYRVSV